MKYKNPLRFFVIWNIFSIFAMSETINGLPTGYQSMKGGGKTLK